MSEVQTISKSGRVLMQKFGYTAEFASLSLPERRAFVLRLIDAGKSNEEIAAETGLTRGNAQQYRSRKGKRDQQIEMFGDLPDPVDPCPEAKKATIARIKAMKRKERVIYHTGHLARDRVIDAALGGAAAAYADAADDGLVILSQRRLESGRFEYIAVRK